MFDHVDLPVLWIGIPSTFNSTPDNILQLNRLYTLQSVIEFTYVNDFILLQI